jgi:3-oxoacyl-[acyl-carrier protein] reductase
MDLKLSGKVIFIAGASRGIGLGIARACLAEGAKVALTARGRGSLEEAVSQLKQAAAPSDVWSFCGDMRQSEDIEVAVEGCEKALGPVWGAVANVGIYPCPPGFEVDDQTWDQGLLQNLTASYRLARTVLKRMLPRHEGALLFTSSIAGMEAMGTGLTYGTAKAAINHLSQELSKICGAAGIRVNTIAPGNIIFPGGDWERRSTGPRAERWNRWVEREVAMKRFGTPQEIGDMATFLLSPRASFVTGATIPVDGGQLR